jgi:hypothetical protein
MVSKRASADQFVDRTWRAVLRALARRHAVNIYVNYYVTPSFNATLILLQLYCIVAASMYISSLIFLSRLL